ncbi:S-layer homology domain-containing protein [Oceanihabitans sediminis]|uniref:S-layer homology domain-containing protein n=1 Tax=Oceanihabitans sediminis TaxID=1812012 RepID=UPI00299D823E|nr:S-layer homology domain-containing protein [Oceanihabitans sediminis]MDX1774902.1 S-layer homology domain-containing protein [Oceanihabitans sediminis]
MKKILSVLMALILLSILLPKHEVYAASFSDVPSTHGFYGEIMFLLENGVINSGTSFGVDQKVTREEVAVIVSRGIGLSGGKTTTPFKDVPASLASSGYIKSAVDAGVLSGYTDGTFRPKEIVNRGQMAIFLANAFKLTTESNSNFKDMSPSMSSYSSVKKIVEFKITTGFSDNTFRPTQTLTRGQISAFLARAMGYGSPTPEQPTQPNQTPVFGDISLGMTMDEVIGLSDGEFVSETNAILTFANVNVFGYLSDVVYEFEENKLVAINVYQYAFDNQNELAILETFFSVMYNELTDIYGKADTIDTDWYDDENSYQLSAYWVNSNHDTLLNVVVTMESDTFGGIRISILE